MRKLIVDLGERSYPIYIGQDLSSKIDLLTPHVGGQLLVVTNTTVGPLYSEKLKQLFGGEGFKLDFVTLPDGEQYKNLEVLNAIFDVLLEKKHNRKTTLIALGGGVVGDMAGFAAASYQRGVNFIQIPTTLLSQVDSSVGGKTGVNHPLGKNMIGAFYQPQCVVIDINVLRTLPEREVSAGLAEVIKYGLIADEAFFCWLEKNIDSLLAGDVDALSYAIEVSCKTKAEVVARDEKESNVRAILNLGHTFGHAIEASQGYGVWLHGEAVAVGMLMAIDLSVRLGWADVVLFERSRQLLQRAKLPVRPPESMSQDEFLAYMSVDKKVLDGHLRLILLKGCGAAVVAESGKDFDMAALTETLTAF